MGEAGEWEVNCVRKGAGSVGPVDTHSRLRVFSELEYWCATMYVNGTEYTNTTAYNSMQTPYKQPERLLVVCPTHLHDSCTSQNALSGIYRGATIGRDFLEF